MSGEGWAALCPRSITIDDAFGKVEADVYNKLWGAAQLGGEFPAAGARQLQQGSWVLTVTDLCSSPLSCTLQISSPRHQHAHFVMRMARTDSTDAGLGYVQLKLIQRPFV